MKQLCIIVDVFYCTLQKYMTNLQHYLGLLCPPPVRVWSIIIILIIIITIIIIIYYNYYNHHAYMYDVCLLAHLENNTSSCQLFRGSVLSRQCDTLRNSDNVTFPYNRWNRSESKITRMFRPVRQVAVPGRSVPSPTASCLYTVFQKVTLLWLGTTLVYINRCW